MALSSLSSVKTDSCLPSAKCAREWIKIGKNWQISPTNSTENPLELYFLIFLQVFLFCKSRHLGSVANTDCSTDRGRCFLSYQCISFTHPQGFSRNSSILHIWPKPLLLFIIHIAAMLKFVLVFLLIHIHTQSNMPLFNEVKWPVYGKISEA